jgi:2-methylcitrate dehydratase PrpD
MEQSLDPSINTLTKTLCSHLSHVQYGDLSQKAIHEVKRGVLDWLGCALAGSKHPAIDKLLDVLQEAGGKPQATVFGRSIKLGFIDAPMANGQMGHLFDFDDTHMGGVLLHTSSPVLSALFSLAERSPVSGRDFMLAYAVGFEAGVRTGRTAPGHHSGGWHLTGTLGSIAAGVAAGKLLKLDKQRLTYAMGIAATQAGGMQQNRGTLCKSFHAGKAASNGTLAALLAERGFDSTQQIIEGDKGFCRIYSDKADPEQLTAGLGEGWLIESNAHKPYACGVVLHPLIDAVIALRTKTRLRPADIDEIALRVHPLALSITGVAEPSTGLQSKFSIGHSAAVAFADGDAGIPQYTDNKARDPVLIALRRKVKPIADPSLRRDEAYASLVAGNTKEQAHVPHASGTVQNPMSDEAIEAKFLANATPAIGALRAMRVCETLRALETLPDMRDLTGLLG